MLNLQEKTFFEQSRIPLVLFEPAGRDQFKIILASEGLCRQTQSKAEEWIGRDELVELAGSIREKISSTRLDTTRKLAEDAKQYIMDHYSESSFSVDDICAHLGVGTSYFSSVFKKDTGMSFVTYLTNVRMNEAQRLLDTTDEKSYIIAGLVGYEEPNYFSYVFKKHFGISPSKYRQH